jgi:acyl-CoA synthetase (NDP forming)
MCPSPNRAPAVGDRMMPYRETSRRDPAPVTALAAVLQPRSVAVIGASHHDGIGAAALRKLLQGEFAGPVYAVNRSGGVIQCLLAYPNVTNIDAPIDLALVAVPAVEVLAVARECAAARVGALVVLSAGFSEIGAEGRAREDELFAICRAAGMRLVGPNCLGVINTDPDVRLNATFIPQSPRPGRIGVMSQSGGLGIAIIDYANEHLLGISTFVSAGNKADLSGNDLLEYWEQDPGTDAIVLYLESFGNPRNFSRIARRVAARKPIIVMKSGRSPAGARAASSHTGALLAASDATADALFHQAGMIRTDTLEQMFDVAALTVSQPLPAGPRIVIVTNAGGPAILCIDTCTAEGLSAAELSAETKQRLAVILPPQASLANPVDMLAAASPEQIVATIVAVANDPGVDAIVAIYIPASEHAAQPAATAIARASALIDGRKPLLAVFMASGEPPRPLLDAVPRVPIYRFPESAAFSLARVARYSRWRARPRQTAPVFADLKREQAATLVRTALARGGGWATPEETDGLLHAYGLPVIAQRRATTPEEAVTAAAALGFPVVLKGIAPHLVHKTDVGAVRMDLRDSDAVARAAREITTALAQAGYELAGFLLQPLLRGGVEMLAGFVHDPVFGAVLACGAGGIVVELIHDVSLRITPLDRGDAAEMIRELKSFPLLDGYRGAARCDAAALEDLILRLSVLAEDFPAIVELDCNPVIVTPKGATIVDARIRLQEPARELSPRAT